MIPHTIWQTYKTSIPPEQSLNSIKTWLTKNPGFEWYYMDDDKCERFIKDHFSNEFVEMYTSLPYGVMKSDVWRIAIVYVYGGVYADIDTKCIKPISSWIKDYQLVVSYEPPTQDCISNFTFASIPKHPALLMCLKNLLKFYNHPNFLDKILPTGTPLQNFGQNAFNEGIKEYLKLTGDSRVRLFLTDENAFTPIMNEKTLVFHETASDVWLGEYNSWRKEQLRDFGY